MTVSPRQSMNLDEKDAVVIAKDKSTALDVLSTLMNKGLKLDRLLAKHPNSSDEMLQQLFTSLDEETVEIAEKQISKREKNTKIPADFESLPVFEGIDLKSVLLKKTPSEKLLSSKAFESALKSKTLPDYVLKWLVQSGTERHQTIYLLSRSKKAIFRSEFMASKYPAIALYSIESDDQSYLLWAQDLGFEVDHDDPDAQEELRWNIDNWIEDVESRGAAMFGLLVPESGSAPTLQGELLRAIHRIRSEYYRNGMMNWGDGSGFYEGFVNLIQKHLTSGTVFSDLVKKIVMADVDLIRRSGEHGKAHASNDSLNESEVQRLTFRFDVERSHQRLDALITMWCEKHPLPISFPN